MFIYEATHLLMSTSRDQTLDKEYIYVYIVLLYVSSIPKKKKKNTQHHSLFCFYEFLCANHISRVDIVKLVNLVNASGTAIYSGHRQQPHSISHSIMLLKIPAFIDGNSLVHYHEATNRFIASNSDGLIKIFDADDQDSEPVSVDAPENITSISSYASKVLFTNTDGILALLELSADVSGDEVAKAIYKCDLPLRGCTFVNEGKRIVCAGDSTDLVVIDALDFTVSKVALADQAVSVAYNAQGELVSIGLSSGDVHVYSVINEHPTLVEKLPLVMPPKEMSSIDVIDYTDQHAEELVATDPVWSKDGESLFVPSSDGRIKKLARSDWKEVSEFKPLAQNLTSFVVSSNGSFLILLCKDGSIHIFDIESPNAPLESLKITDVSEGLVPINIAASENHLFVGTTAGELHSFDISQKLKAKSSKSNNVRSEVRSLFLDEADESNDEDDEPIPVNGHARSGTEKRKFHNLDDSHIIDEDDDDEEEDDDHPDPEAVYHNKSVDDFLQDRRKRQRHHLSREPTPVRQQPVEQDILPYTPGSTPWVKSVNSSTSATKRRYLFMNSIGYAWSVQNASVESPENQQSITVTFFDRSTNKDYHFIDFNRFDLCSLNKRGILLANSGYKSDSRLPESGKVYYRHHATTNDSWERNVPLLPGEYLTSVCLTCNNTTNSGDSLIVVGSNLGYTRFFNLYGLCTNIIKMEPVVTMISSPMSTVFVINRAAIGHYNYSIIDADDDYKFIQQAAPILLKESGKYPLLKGIFFNESSDPCIVAGFDDSLTILSHWRETGNARWVPVLSCGEVVRDYGLSESKKNWKAWPLGVTEDKFNCLILKNNDNYPGFPLSLPIELEVKLPVKSFKYLQRKKEHSNELEEDEGDEDDEETKIQKTREEDPEEIFLRASTFGKLLTSSVNEQEDQDEQMERLNDYSVMFDKALLKLFASACQESRLNKALSVIKLVKNDKALVAASKIAERFEYVNLARKIGKLREDLHDMEEGE